MNDLYIVLSPVAVLAGFVGLLLLILGAFLGGVWAGRGDQPEPPAPEPPCDRTECAETQDLTPKARTQDLPESRTLEMRIPAPRSADETKVLYR